MWSTLKLCGFSQTDVCLEAFQSLLHISFLEIQLKI